MTIWRIITLVGLGFTVIQTVVDLTDRDGGAETAAQVAMLAKVLGSSASDAGKTPDPAQLLSNPTR